MTLLTLLPPKANRVDEMEFKNHQLLSATVNYDILRTQIHKTLDPISRMVRNIKDIKGFCILLSHPSTRTDGRMQICCTANSSSTNEEQYIGCNRKDDGSFVELHKDKPKTIGIHTI